MSRRAQAYTDESNGTGTIQQQFPLLKLPLEIQLRIIASCVVSEIPVVNLGTKAWQWIKVEGRSYRRAQDYLTLNLLMTCRSYHDEGWKCFWRENVFLYTSPEALGKVMEWSSRSTRISTVSMLRHLSVRVPAGTQSRPSKIASDYMLRTLVGCLQDCWLFEALDRLQIDFISGCITQDQHAIVDPIKKDIAQIGEVSRLYGERQRDYPNSTTVARAVGRVTGTHPRRTNFGGPKQEIVLTGLPKDDEHKLEALALRLISTTIRPRGRIGFGKGTEGTRYWCEQDNSGDLIVRERKPVIKWVAAEGLEEWIMEHGIHDASSAQSWKSRLFSHIGRCDPFFKGWA